MKLTFIQRFFTHLTFFILFLSGIIWLVLDLNYSETWRIVRVYSLRFHGASSFGFLIVFGMVLSTHISFNWQVKRNRRVSGIILTALLAILILSGYLLYYLGNEEVRFFTSYLHWVLGVLCGVVFLIHILAKVKDIQKVQISPRKKYPKRP